MRTPGGSVAEMHFLSRLLPRRAARRSPDEAIAERLLTGQDPGPGASPAQHALELALLAAARPGTERELSGESAAVAAFVLAAKTSGARARPRTVPSGRKVPVMAAGIMTTVMVAICGTAVAGALPAPLQRLAHTTFGAPAPGQPGRPAPAPAVSASPARTGGTPVRTGTASHPAASAGSTAKTHGKSASAPGQVKKAATSTPTATTTASATSSGNGKGKGKGKGKRERKGETGRGTAKPGSSAGQQANGAKAPASTASRHRALASRGRPAAAPRGRPSRIPVRRSARRGNGRARLRR